MNDVYYHPEDFGLEIVASIDFDYDDYGFDMVVVWKSKEDGKMYWAADSGCSCPSPFENYHDVASLEPLNDLVSIENNLKEYHHGNVEMKEQFLREVEKVYREK